MKTKATEGNPANELQFELKYCERCGRLWLRPVEGGQVYCAACGRAMAELPPASRDRSAGGARMPIGPQWDGDDSDLEGYEECEGQDLDAAGGVA